MKHLLILLSCIALAGCLTTTKPVFDTSNSAPAAESAAFMRFVEQWEAKLGKENSPREIATNGQRVIDLGGHVVVEELNMDGGADYYSLGMLGDRLLACMAHHKNIEQIAARHGVRVEVDVEEDADPALPAPMLADGDVDALFAFVVDVFTNGSVVCETPTPQSG